MIWTILWLLWIAAFFAIEIPALLSKEPGASFTSHIKAWFLITGPGRNTALGWLLRGLLAAALTWLKGHFLGLTP